MHVSDLSLEDFRSYRRLVVSLEPGVTALIGPNGQGKTNLIEAVDYLSGLSSHRAGADTALVRRAGPGDEQPGGAVLRARVVHGRRPTVMELEIIAGRANRARLNRGSVRPRDLLGVLRTVLFSPEDLALVREEPAGRRRLLDDLAVTLRPALAGVRAEHDKILAQRAGLLRSARAARTPTASMLSTLEVWDAQLAAAASRLIAARIDVVERLRPWVAGAYGAVSADPSPAFIAYRSSLALHEGAPEPDPRIGGARAGEDRPEVEAGLRLPRRAVVPGTGPAPGLLRDAAPRRRRLRGRRRARPPARRRLLLPGRRPAPGPGPPRGRRPAGAGDRRLRARRARGAGRGAVAGGRVGAEP